MRKFIGFLVGFFGFFAVLFLVSEELGVMPRGPGWVFAAVMTGLAVAQMFFRPKETVLKPMADSLRGVQEKLSKTNFGDEAQWAQAAAEYDGPGRRAGLHARAFSEAGGDEAKTRAVYLRLRVRELSRDGTPPPEPSLPQPAVSASPDGPAVLAGQCPNCSTPLRLDAKACTNCDALFTLEHGWKVLPRALPANAGSDDQAGACPRCHASLPLDAPECTSCGARFTLAHGWRVLPKAFLDSSATGQCPCCSAPLPMNALECTKCDAIFDETSSWRVQPQS